MLFLRFSHPAALRPRVSSAPDTSSRSGPYLYPLEYSSNGPGVFYPKPDVTVEAHRHVPHECPTKLGCKEGEELVNPISPQPHSPNKTGAGRQLTTRHTHPVKVTASTVHLCPLGSRCIAAEAQRCGILVKRSPGQDGRSQKTDLLKARAQQNRKLKNAWETVVSSNPRCRATKAEPFTSAFLPNPVKVMEYFLNLDVEIFPFRIFISSLKSQRSS